MTEFHFLRPHWFALLPLLVLLLWWLGRRARHRRSWSAVCDPELLPYLLQDDGRSTARRGGRIWIGLAGLLLITALAGPAWERLPQPVFRDTSALVIALDLSRSMDAADLPPGRLDRARLKLIDLLNARGAGQTALLVFAGAAFTVTPLTDDVDTILAQLPALETGLMPHQGSRPDRALEQAAELLRQAGVRRGEVLLITDGTSDPDAMRDAIEQLRSQGHRLSVLGVGTAEGAPVPLVDGGFLKDTGGVIVVPQLEESHLREWADRGGGRYTRLRSDERDVHYLLEGMSSSRAGDEAVTDLHSDQWREQGPWLILLALPLLLPAFRRGLWVLAALLVLPLPQPAQAFEWSDLWQRPDQQAMQELQQGDAPAAAERFEDPRWKAAALYRAGRYAEAADTLSGYMDPDSRYNQGNALARAGRYDEAMARYEQVLEQDPEHEDARHNLELLRELTQPPQASSGSSSQQPSTDDSPQKPGEGSDQGQQGESAAQPDSPPPSEGQDGETEAEQEAQRNAEDGSEGQQQDPGAEPVPQDNAAPQQRQALQAEESDRDQGEEASERWLRRIPDDPGGLLRRKFLYQYQQREANTEDEQQPW